MPKIQERFQITAMPWASGLATEGGQATVPENTLWEAKNVDMDTTGRLFKRPGLRLWGQKLRTQPEGVLRYTEVFDDLNTFSYAYSGTANDVAAALEGANLVFYAHEAGDGTSSLTYTRAVQPSDGTVATNNKCTTVLYLKSMTALPAQSTTTSADNGFAVHIRSDHAFVLTLLFLSTDIFYYNGTNFVACGGSDALGDGQWHKVQVDITNAATGAVSIYVDDETTSTDITATTYTDTSPGANQIAVSASTNSNAAYAVALNLIQYTDGNTLNAAIPKVMQGWSSSSPKGDHILVATEDALYDDKHHSGFFANIGRAPHGDIVFIPWLSEMIIGGSNDVCLRWNGNDAAVLCPEDVPAGVIAGTAHQGRLYVATEDRPLTVQYSGANDLDTWVEYLNNERTLYVPAEFTIPDARGGRITAMRGDFYGLLIIWTETSTWVFSTQGVPAVDGVMKRVSENVGCVGPRAHDAIGRDVLFLSKDGMYSLSTVQEFGDLNAATVSARIRGLWQHNNQVDRRKIITNRNSCVVHAPNENKTYVTVQHTGYADLNSVYVYNHATKQWVGPWEPDSTLIAANVGGGGMRCIDYIKVSGQGRQFLFTTSSLGDVAYFGLDRKSDYPPDHDTAGYSIQFYIKSARLDGRSHNPGLVRRYKRWRGIWFYVLPRDNSKLKLTWNVDGVADSESATVVLNPYTEDVLDDTFVLGTSALGDPERIGIVWIPLDARGRWLEFIVEIEDDTTYDDKDIALVGFEIDATWGDEDKQ